MFRYFVIVSTFLLVATTVVQAQSVAQTDTSFVVVDVTQETDNREDGTVDYPDDEKSGDDKHDKWIDVLSIDQGAALDVDDGEDDTQAMNKADLVESVSSGASESTGTETQDIGAPAVTDTAGIESDELGVDTNDSTETTALPAYLDLDSNGDDVPAESRTFQMMSNVSKMTVAEVQEVLPGGEYEDIGLRLGDDVYVRSGFMKIGDIKGESTDDASQGNVELTWKVEEGEAAKKPKEIVVVGSKVETDGASPMLLQALTHNEVVDDESLEEFMNQLAHDNEDVETLTATEESVGIIFENKVKLFGFIPLTMKADVSVDTTVDEFGSVKVKFPWWHALTSKPVSSADLQNELESAVLATEISTWQGVSVDDVGLNPQPEPPSAEVPTETFSLNFAEVKAQLFDTAMNVIRKIGA